MFISLGILLLCLSFAVLSAADDWGQAVDIAPTADFVFPADESRAMEHPRRGTPAAKVALWISGVALTLAGLFLVGYPVDTGAANVRPPAQKIEGE